MERLKDQAKELGATTRFSATEAANGMEFLARAGWNVEEILAGMPGLLDLAAASAMDLGRAADITSNIMSAFNMEAEQAGYVADVLAQAAANANTDVEQMGEAMKYVAPTANSLGLGIEETAAAVMLFSDAGIQGSQAGRAFGTSLLRLSNPTSSMTDEMKKLGVSFFDAQGNIKDLPDIVKELENGMKGYTKEQKSATLATLFGTEAQRHWSILLEQGAGSLSKNTNMLIESEGAAAQMAETMQDNAKGAMIEFKSALEGAGIAIAEHVIPTVTELTKSATELVRRFGELDEEQQKQIIKWAAVAAAIGPASIALGSVAKAGGTFLEVGGNLAKMLGGASGKGLIGRLGLLGGPTGVAIVAGGALSFLAYKLYDAHKESGKLHEISTEVADSMFEQADKVESLVDEYDSLQMKSRLSTDELGRMLDIQKELEQTQNPAKVAELQERYEELAEKSGLTNDEIDKLLKLNNDIIEQSPNVEKSFTDKGNAVVESTDAVKEHINALREMAYEELLIERDKSLMNEIELRERIKDQTNEILELEDKMNALVEYRDMPLEKVEGRLEEIDKLLMEGMLTQEEYNELTAEQDLLLQAQHGTITDTYNELVKQREELIKKRDLNEEELAKLDSVNERIAEVLLAQVDINYEKGKGLEQLDDTIDKLQKERDEIIKNMTEDERRNGKYDEYLEELDSAISKHNYIRDEIKEETGFMSQANVEQERMNRLLGAQGGVLKGNNRLISDGITLADKQHRTLSSPARKDITVSDKGTIKDLNRRASASVSKPVDVFARGLGSLNSAISSPISKTVNLRTSGSAGLAYASGTPSGGHPGGTFLAGEEGWELGRLGDRWEMLNFGMYDRPKGYEVFPHQESKKILKAMNNIPKYANGTGRTGGMLDAISNGTSLLQATLEQNKLLAALLEKDTTISIDGKSVARQIASPMQHELGSRKYSQTKARRR